MKIIQKPHSSTLAVVLMGLLTIGPGARGDLVSLDSAFGADTITLDTSTGLAWLDLDLTVARSFNDINAALGPGGEFEGYRFASADEVLALWTNAAIPDITVVGPIGPDDFTAANLIPAQALAGLVGVTAVTPLGSLSEGLTDTPPGGDDTMRIVGELSICTEPLCAIAPIPAQIDVALASLGPNVIGTDAVVSFVGSYLVNTSLGPIVGSVSGMVGILGKCTNSDTQQSVAFFGGGLPAAWNCTANGLVALPGNPVVEAVYGFAACGPGTACDVAGSVEGLSDINAACVNSTTGQVVAVVDSGPDFDCAAAGFNAVSGDRIRVFVTGQVPVP